MILALKTADHITSAWLFADADVSEAVGHMEWESGRSLSDQLLARLAGFIEAHQLELASLTGLLIFSGPGSFTSLRIGHTTLNALADSLNIPVVGVGGEDWLKHGRQLLTQAQSGRPALPEYGAPANITKPKS